MATINKVNSMIVKDAFANDCLKAQNNSTFKFAVNANGKYGYITNNIFTPFVNPGDSGNIAYYNIVLPNLANEIGDTLIVKDSRGQLVTQKLIDNDTMIVTILAKSDTYTIYCKNNECIKKELILDFNKSGCMFYKDGSIYVAGDPEEMYGFVSSYSGVHSYSYNSSNMTVSYNMQNKLCSVYWGAIDLTNYTKLTINATKNNSKSGYFYGGVGTLAQFQDTSSTALTLMYNTTGANCNHTYDISSLKGKYYVGFKFGNNAKVNLTMTTTAVYLS